MKTYEQFINESIGNYPLVRHIISYNVGVNFLKEGDIFSRPEAIRRGLVKDEKDNWWTERSKSDNAVFGTEDLIFNTIDWFKDYGHETGHGPIMIYFKDNIFTSFKVTMTLCDSYDYVGPVISSKEIPIIYKNIIEFKGEKREISEDEMQNILKGMKNQKRDDNFYKSCAEIIISNLEHKNEQGFYDHYTELQIHAKSISNKHINFIKMTNNYYDKSSDDKKEKFDKLKKENNL